MPWLPTPPEDVRDGPVAALYRDARERFGFVPDAVKVLITRPEVARALNGLKSVLLGDASSLGARRADILAVAVSGMNHCEYCGTAHAGMLSERQDLDRDSAIAVYRDWRRADLDTMDRAMLAFAEKLTFAAATMTEEDVEGLLSAGFDEVNVYDIVMLTAYRNFINRVHDALGASPDNLRDRFGPDVVDLITRS